MLWMCTSTLYDGFKKGKKSFALITNKVGLWHGRIVVDFTAKNLTFDKSYHQNLKNYH